MKNNFKIKAAVLEKSKHPLVMKDIFLKEKIKTKQVLVKIYYSGICGSQIGEINAIKGKDKYLPHLLGHEATGKVIQTNSLNSKFKIGDHVILHWQKTKLKDSETPVYLDLQNRKINAGWITTFNNYSVVSENRLTKLPKHISKKSGVLFGCGLTTAYGSLFNNIKKKEIKSKKILLTGFGMIGQIIVSLINASGGDNITLIEKNKKKINLVKKKYKKIKVLNKLNYPNKETYDIAFETTGHSKLIEFSYNNIKNNGKLILIGVPNHQEKIKINSLGINYGKKIIGSYGGNIEPEKDIPKIAKFILKHKLNLNNFLCGPFDFNKINKVLDNMKKGKIIKKPIIKF